MRKRKDDSRVHCCLQQLTIWVLELFVRCLLTEISNDVVSIIENAKTAEN